MVPDCIALNFEGVAYPDIAVKVVADNYITSGNVAKITYPLFGG